MSFLSQQKLEYPDHKDEIAFLNAVLAEIPLPHPPEVKSSIDMILARLDLLMTTDKAVLKDYNQFEVHR
jgi:hypothetical protein